MGVKSCWEMFFFIVIPTEIFFYTKLAYSTQIYSCVYQNFKLANKKRELQKKRRKTNSLMCMKIHLYIFKVLHRMPQRNRHNSSSVFYFSLFQF